MVVKRFIGKIIIALIRASIRAFFGMLIGIAIVTITLMTLLFFGILTPSAGSETMVLEIIGLLIAGASIGAVVGFFDMLDRKVISEKHEKNQNWHKN